MSEMVLQLDIDEICRMYIDELKSVSQIATHFGVNFGTIKLRLNKSGVEFRTHSENQTIVMNRPEVLKNVSNASKRSSKQRTANNIKNYGAVVPANGPKIKPLWKEKHLKETGFEWPNQRPDVRNQYKETCLDRYDVDNVSKVPEIEARAREERWLNKTDEELNEIREKTKKTCIENLDVDNPMKNKNVVKNVRKNYKEKTGFDWMTKNPEVREKIDKTRLKNSLKKIKRILEKYNLELLDEFNITTEKVKLKCLKCNHVFKSTIDYIKYDYGLCQVCYPRNVSHFFESKILDFIIKILPNKIIESNNRTFIPSKKEIDILIKEQKIAIECDGLFYHSEEMLSNKNYHLNKTNECEELGFQLIHIFEDEWMFNEELVKERLRNIFKVSKCKRIHGRKCIIQEISPPIKNEFLEKYHLQGKDSSTIKLGAFYNDELVSVMTFSKGNISKGSKAKDGIWELNRFCSNYNYHIPGIASKLLTYFKRNYTWKEIFSYADRRWSQGKLYYMLGFELEKITKPNYWYVKSLKRIHRFNLRKQKDEPNDISESELRQEQGYKRIYDCGHLKFKLENSRTNL